MAPRRTAFSDVVSRGAEFVAPVMLKTCVETTNAYAGDAGSLIQQCRLPLSTSAVGHLADRLRNRLKGDRSAPAGPAARPDSGHRPGRAAVRALARLSHGAARCRSVVRRRAVSSIIAASTSVAAPERRFLAVASDNDQVRLSLPGPMMRSVGHGPM